MEAYLLKASAILGIFLLTYQGLLRKETFFRLNRFFLLAGIGAALLLPLVSIQEEITIPVELLQGQATPVASPASPGNAPGWDVLLRVGYLLGALFFAFLAGRQILSLLGMMRNPNAERRDGVTLVPTKRVESPFSFFRYVFYNPDLHDQAELQQVLEHEKAHARQLHSLDVLLGRVTAILLWANPFAWWYQKSIQQNLEYLADAQAVRKLPSVRDYQYTLLKVSGNTVNPALVSSFNSSLIKKRIVMLQQNQSKTIHLLKYLLILPVLAAFLMAFNRETVYVPQGDSVQELILSDAKTIEVTIDKGTTDQELVDLKKKLAEDGIDFSYTTVRNDAGQIIDISFNISGKAENGSPFSGNYNSNSEEPIKPVVIYINSEGGVFFGQLSTFEKFKTGNKIHFGSDADTQMVFVTAKGSHTIPGDSSEHETIEIRNVNGKKAFIVNQVEVPEEEFEKAYLRNLEEREKFMIKMAQEHDSLSGNKMVWVQRMGGNDAETIEIKETDGEKIIIVDGKEVRREDLGKEGKAKKIFVKMLETDEDPEVEVEIKEIRVTEDGETERIIEIIPEGDEKARYKAITIDADKAGDFSNIGLGKSNVFFYRDGESPLILIDGKKAGKKKMDKLDPDQIESINVWKGDKAVEKYGKKAADGVIEITTKKQ